MEKINNNNVWVLMLAFVSMMMWLSWANIQYDALWVAYIIMAGHWTIARALMNKDILPFKYYGSLALVLIAGELLSDLLGKYMWIAIVIIMLWVVVRAVKNKIMQDATDNLIKVYKETYRKK